ncbi:MAG TPA: GNAT family N-acetyltransferase [Planctomycetota bacterium]|nr:GNAT family N-acetyltransferase [Planctomycetota bacterium]
MTPPPEPAIERLEPAHADLLAAFFEALAPDPIVRRFFHPHPLTAEHARALCAGAPSRRDRYYVIRYGGPVVAYFMLRGWDEGYAVPSFGVCTLPALRDAGLGKLALVHAIREAEQAGAPRLRLTVYRENERAVAVYRRFGFAYSEKNAEELVGVLPLPAPPLPEARASLARLEAWRGGASAP